MFTNALTRKMPCHGCERDENCPIQDEFMKIWDGLTSSIEDLTFKCLAKEILNGEE